MAREIALLFTCFLVATILNLAVGLKCYNCLKCNDPFKKEGQSTIDCSGVCMKVKMSTDGVGGVAKGDVGRSCLPTKMKTTCEEGEQGGYKGEVCTCDTDGCNGSDMTKFTIATGIMAAVAILKNMDMF